MGAVSGLCNRTDNKKSTKINRSSRVEGDVTRADVLFLFFLFLAQQSITTLLRHCFEWLQHCSNIRTLCCAQNRPYESSAVTSPTEKCFSDNTIVGLLFTDFCDQMENSLYFYIFLALYVTL